MNWRDSIWVSDSVTQWAFPVGKATQRRVTYERELYLLTFNHMIARFMFTLLVCTFTQNAYLLHFLEGGLSSLHLRLTREPKDMSNSCKFTFKKNM